MPNQLTIAIAGATGAVGREMLTCLEKRRFPHARLRLFASARSAGTALPFAGCELTVEALTADALAGIDIALFSAGSSITRDLAPAAARHNCVIIDNSSAFRMDPSVPLVVPEVNPAALVAPTNKVLSVKWSAQPVPAIVANPNCSTIILLMALTPLRTAFGIERAVVSTYQAASGAGAKGMDELEEQTRADLRGERPAPKVFHEPYAFNLFSHNTAIDPLTGLNVEETKVILETRKIWGEESLPPAQRAAITATCIRVPVRRAHAESVNITLRREATARQVREALAAFPGVQVVDDRDTNNFPTPLKASGKDEVLVGRIRPDASLLAPDELARLARDRGGLDDIPCRGFDLFICGDQLLKGAALNAVQIAELLIK
ncbi:MAG: aspartate-semialdehyde dehydrogenase [Phycisphaeraceae bacterium]|nr:aspartate-semialdehyde dehydrogenase [Phycisphaeraceae bacterium]